MESFDSNQNLSSSKYRRILLPISFLLGLQGYLFLKVNSISFFQLEEEKWDHPTQEQQKQPQHHQHHHQQQQQFPVIDILSIGSETRLEYLQAQRETFASHRAVRNFFFVTERNDTDPTCSKLLLPEDVYRITRFCKGRRSIHRASYLMRYLRNAYTSKKWLMKKKSPVGWVSFRLFLLPLLLLWLLLLFAFSNQKILFSRSVRKLGPHRVCIESKNTTNITNRNFQITCSSSTMTRTSILLCSYKNLKDTIL